MQAAAAFGAAINDTFGWRVNLTAPDLTVVLHVHNEDVAAGFRLTPRSQHFRPLAVISSITLNGVIAYSLLHLARPQPGEVVLDPMCGSTSSCVWAWNAQVHAAVTALASRRPPARWHSPLAAGVISVEGCQNFPQCVHLAGDIDATSVKHAQTNLQHTVATECPGVVADVVRWDADRLALATGSVDVRVRGPWLVVCWGCRAAIDASSGRACVALESARPS